MNEISTAKHVVIIDKDKIAALLTAIVLLFLISENALYKHFGLGNLLSGFQMSIIEIVIMLIVLLLCNGVNYQSLIFIIVMALIISLSFMFHPETRTEISKMFFSPTTLKKLVILPLTVSSLKDRKTFVRLMVIISYISGTLIVISNFVWGYDYDKWGVFQYMLFALDLMIPTIFIMQKAFKSRNVVDIIVSIFFSANIIIYGHRGAIIVLVMTAAIYYNRYVGKDVKIYFTIFLIAVTILLFVFHNELLVALSGFLSKFGIESRTIEKLLKGTISDASERNVIYYVILQNIVERFPFGFGIGGDRVILNKYFYGRNLYSHNFILELSCEFGLLLGLFFSFIIIKIWWDTITKISDENDFETITPFLIPSVLTLLTSSSLWETYFLWIGLAVFFSCEDRKRIKVVLFR